MPKNAAQNSPAPIPLTILTGFLGSGKTTLLNHILHADHGLRVAVLVNDFGAINIDTQLVVGIQGETVSLANGCICCTIRDDLLLACLNLIRSESPPQYIIVETSGVSDPLAVAQTFLLPELSPFIQVDSILTVVDVDQLGSLDENYAHIAEDQIAVADIVVLNKVDLVTREILDELRKQWIPPRARVIEATFGKVPLALVLGVGRFAPERLAVRQTRDIHVHEAGVPTDHEHEHEHEAHRHAESDHHHHNHSLVFNSWSWTTDRPLAYGAVRKATRMLPTTIFRAKGVLFLADVPDRRGVLHVVGKRVRLTIGAPWEAEKPFTQIVAIGSHGGVEPDRLARLFEDCLVANQNQEEQDRLAEVVMDWLRAYRAQT